MAKIPVTNNTAMHIYVGASMIPPGETLHFEESEVPLHLRPPAPEPAPAAPAPDPLMELIEKPAAEVIKHLPELSDEDLTTLGDMEQTTKARKTLLAAISEETLQRAEKASGGAT